jgi:general secretion pathway protein J
MNRTTRRYPDSRSRLRGFTLLEILVAMLVLTLIVTSSFGALRLGERSWQAGAARSAETETLRTVANLLQRQLGQLVPVTWKVDTENHIAFAGARDQLRFIAPAPAHRRAGGLFEYALVLEPRREGFDLVLHYRQHDPGGEVFSQTMDSGLRMTLVEGLQSGEFAYYGAPDRDTPRRWQAQWSSGAGAIPQLVRARLLPAAEREPWPDLLLALNAEQAP